MALDNYSNLKAAIKDWAHRSDMTDLRLDDYISLAEAEMYSHPEHPIRIRQMEARATAVTSTSERFLALPEGFIEMRRLKLRLSGRDKDISFLAPEQLNPSGVSGTPVFFSVTSQIEFDRVPDSDYTIEMQYFRRLTGLSDANPVNDILSEFPGIYLHGALYNLFKWSTETEQAAIHKSEFYSAIRGANKNSKKGRYGPAPAIRTEGTTP